MKLCCQLKAFLIHENNFQIIADNYKLGFLSNKMKISHDKILHEII